jgi:hypothetical protein
VRRTFNKSIRVFVPHHEVIAPEVAEYGAKEDVRQVRRSKRLNHFDVELCMVVLLTGHIAPTRT